jgi:response regulator RpfG family c-di-GMP phosphodiesterase
VVYVRQSGGTGNISRFNSTLAQSGRPLSILKTPVFPEARILIVDDEEANVRVLERLLRSEGHSQIRATTDSASALEIASSLGDVLEGVRSQAGGHFDPDVAETFLVNHGQLMDLEPAAN